MQLVWSRTMACVRVASAVVLFLNLASWVLALGGLGSIDRTTCKAQLPSDADVFAVAKCSREWSW
jgi:hypothetical protein